jgi:hypothetical protein
VKQQAQGSIGWHLPETEGVGTSPDLEKSLETPPARVALKWVTVRVKSEKARCSVNILRNGDDASVRSSAAREDRQGRGENFGGQDRLVRRSAVKRRSKHQEPHGRQHLARGAGSERRKPSRRWKTVETEHGQAVAPPVPKRQAEMSAAGVDSSAANDGGAIFGNPQERHPGRARKV